MNMTCVGLRIGLFLSVALVSHCVLTEFVSELHFSVSQTNQPKKEDVEVKAGSSVSFICKTRGIGVSWYKNTKPWAWYDKNNPCTFNTIDQRFEEKDCTNGKYTIVIRNINKYDEADWVCLSNRIRSQTIHMIVRRTGTTTRSPTTRRTTALQHYSPTVLPSNGPISDMTTTPAENEPITNDQSEIPDGKLNMTAVIGGAVGGVIVLVLIITIVAVVRRTKRHSPDEKKPTNDDRTEGSPGGQRNDFGSFEEDIGGQNAAISDTKNPTPAKVVAENPMYESYGQEDGGDHVPDVYSVVQKPLKSQSSTNDGSKDPNPPVTEDNVADVYSVVQKPSKLQESGSVSDGTKDTQPSGSDEMGDVYSVVQKPAKG